MLAQAVDGGGPRVSCKIRLVKGSHSHGNCCQHC